MNWVGRFKPKMATHLVDKIKSIEAAAKPLQKLVM